MAVRPVLCALPENTGESIGRQVMDENQVCQAGQGIFGITDLLLQKARNLFFLKQRVEHQTWERLSDSAQNVLQNHTEPQVHSSNTTPCCKHAGFTIHTRISAAKVRSGDRGSVSGSQICTSSSGWLRVFMQLQKHRRSITLLFKQP